VNLDLASLMVFQRFRSVSTHDKASLISCSAAEARRTYEREPLAASAAADLRPGVALAPRQRLPRAMPERAEALALKDELPQRCTAEWPRLRKFFCWRLRRAKRATTAGSRPLAAMSAGVSKGACSMPRRRSEPRGNRGEGAFVAVQFTPTGADPTEALHGRLSEA
jgi:hypothetical protein